MSAAFGRYGRNRRLAKMERGPFLWENGPLFALVRHMCFVRVPEKFSCSRLANGVFCVANGYANASVAGACEDNEPHRQAVFARGQASCPPPVIRATANRAAARQRFAPALTGSPATRPPASAHANLTAAARGRGIAAASACRCAGTAPPRTVHSPG